MKIGLIDVDSKNFPNIPLMKLSAYHKEKGDSVQWYNGLEWYDIVYVSKVFSFSPDYGFVINADKIYKGGTGYDIKLVNGKELFSQKNDNLPYEIEHAMPDYSLYGITDTAYGFLTRGCPRACNFCHVVAKEGRISNKVADLNEFWSGQKNIVLCDPNILACKDYKTLLNSLIDSDAYIDFNQGLDIRLMTEEKAELISKVKTHEIHFAWDNYQDKDIVLPKLKLFSKYRNNPHDHTAIVYVLVNFNSTLEQDLERIYTLRDLGYWAYVMIYDKQHCSPIYKKLQRWCNNRFIFASCPKFEDYKKQEQPKQLPNLFEL